MGKRKRKTIRKQAEPSMAPTSPQREEENPQPPPPPVAQQGAMIPANALEMLLRATNPNVDWTATLAALRQLAVTVTAATPTVPSVTAPSTTVPSENPPQTTNIAPTEPSPQESSQDADQQTSPTQTLVIPLDISHISVYKSPDKISKKGEKGTVEGGETAGDATEEQTEEGEKKEAEESMDQGGEKKKNGETSEERNLNETARHQGLMTDEEFEALLEGAQRIGQEAAGVAEGLDLAPPVAEEDKFPSEPLDIPSQPEEKVEPEEPKEVSGEREFDKGQKKKAPKASKRKLMLTDDTTAEGKKPMRTSRGHLAREQKGSGEAVAASEAVDVSSGDDDTPHYQEESVATLVGRSKKDSPTKPGENPQTAAPASSTRGEVNPQSSLPTDQEELISPTKPGEGEVPRSEEDGED